MPAVSTSVKYFHSAMPGAPVLNGTAGSLVAILDACLVNGFGLKTATSVVVASNIATVTISGGIGAIEADSVVTVAGATPSGLNGEKRVIATTATTLTFDATGIANQTATGAITLKLSPLGWAKSFSGTNLAVYRSNDVLSTRMFLRVDDTGALNARIGGYESMSDVNTGIGAFPIEANAGYWPKANSEDDSARTWTLIGDSKTFYISLHTPPASSGYPGANSAIHGFGDFTSLKSGDAYSCFCSSAEASQSYSGSADYYSICTSYVSNYPAYSPRSFTGIGSTSAIYKSGESYGLGSITNFSGTSSGNPFTPNYPNPCDNSLILTRSVVIEGTSCMRGYLRGFLLTPQNCHSAFAWRDKIAGIGAYAGRKLLAVKYGGAYRNESNAVVFFDITGPWS